MMDPGEVPFSAALNGFSARRMRNFCTERTALVWGVEVDGGYCCAAPNMLSY
jgi:hypothetical protein